MYCTPAFPCGAPAAAREDLPAGTPPGRELDCGDASESLPELEEVSEPEPECSSESLLSDADGERSTREACVVEEGWRTSVAGSRGGMSGARGLVAISLARLPGGCRGCTPSSARAAEAERKSRMPATMSACSGNTAGCWVTGCKSGRCDKLRSGSPRGWGWSKPPCGGVLPA